MSAPGRTPEQMLQARDRQVCQAAGLRALADLVERNERVSVVLDSGLRRIGGHMGGEDRTDDLLVFADAAYWDGAVLLRDGMANIGAYRAVDAAWSEYVQVHLQCDAPAPEPESADSEQPTSGATEFATGSHDRGISP